MSSTHIMSTTAARKALDLQFSNAVGLKERSRKKVVALGGVVSTRIPAKITVDRSGTSGAPQVGGKVVPPRAASSAEGP